jgi:hypothetical protein
MRISRLILSGAAIGTIIGTGRADLISTHVFNPVPLENGIRPVACGFWRVRRRACIH